MAWTEERIDTLKKFWIEGMSASQIASRLGDVSRNAVIGKVNRLGLSGKGGSPSSGGRPVGSKLKNGAVARRGGYARKISVRAIGNTLAYYETELEPVDAEDVVVPLSKKLQLIELTDDTCKFPSGDPTQPGFSFCGHQTKEDTPYCEYHSKVVFLRPTDRRRKR